MSFYEVDDPTGRGKELWVALMIYFFVFLGRLSMVVREHMSLTVIPTSWWFVFVALCMAWFVVGSFVLLTIVVVAQTFSRLESPYHSWACNFCKEGDTRVHGIGILLCESELATIHVTFGKSFDSVVLRGIYLMYYNGCGGVVCCMACHFAATISMRRIFPRALKVR